MQEAPLMENYVNDEGEFDDEAFFADVEKYQMEMRIIRTRTILLEDYGISDEDWENTPLRIQSILVTLHRTAERHEELMYELESWRDSMPI